MRPCMYDIMPVGGAIRLLLRLLVGIFLLSQSVSAQHYSFSTVTQDADAEFPSRLNYIMEGSRGCLWIATRSGLGRYDGNILKKYLHDDADTLSLPGNDVYSLAEDVDKDLWLFTVAGITRFDYQTDTFHPLTDEAGNKLRGYSGIAWREGILFSTGLGILYYNKRDNSMKTIAKMPGSYWVEKMQLLGDTTLLLQCRSHRIWRIPLSQAGDSIPVGESETFNCGQRTTDILMDSQQRVWIATLADGLFCYTPSGERIAAYTKENGLLPTNHIQSLAAKGEYILIGTRSEGLLILKPESQQVWQFKHKPGEGQFTIPGNLVNELYCDKYGNVMMGIVDHGLVALDKVFIRSYTQQGAGFGKGPIGGSIMSLYAEGNNIWVGTTESGLNLFNPADNTFKAIPSTQGKQIFSITNYAPGKLLLSIYDEGLRIFDTATGKLTPLTLMNEAINRNVFRSGNGVYVWKNSEETILTIGDSLFIHHLKTGHFDRAIEEKKGLLSSGTLKIVGTVGDVSYLADRTHLLRFDHASRMLSALFQDTTTNEGINTATMTPDGCFWLGTNFGLKKFDPTTREATPILNDRFTDVMLLQADSLGRIWIGTYYGLFSYDPATEKFIAYNQQDGALPNEYIRTSSLISGGHLYMGGVKGLTQISYTHAVPAHDIPTFDVAECTLDGQIVGNPFYHAKKTLELPYESNFFLRVMTTEKSRFRIREYRYLIPEYTEVPIERSGAELRLYRLSAGSYTVQVSCTLNDGSWSPFQELVKFEVSAPWYKSGWFFTVIALLVLLIVGGITAFILFRKQQRMQQELAQNRRRINEEKIDFLVNVSHELRTPLTLIYAPLNRMLQRTKPDAWNYRMLLTACRQSARMRDIINMVLDLEKMERKSVQLQFLPHPFNKWVEDNMKDFVIEGKERGIQVVLEADARIKQVDFDIQKCDIVLNNLLINALKHSPQQTTITVKTELDTEHKQACVRISDEGTGLQAVNQEELFTRFYQGAKEKNGTGLGLAYSKVLLDQHGGTIGAYNNETKGATFFFTLPLRQAAVKEEEAVSILSRPVAQPALAETEAVTAEEQMGTAAGRPASLLPYTLLVVDDQETITQFLQEALRESFQEVLIAKDGVEALKVLGKNRPDAVISDVMMPRMDGYELCSKIKGDLTISHIPVILLTAKTDEQSILIGYKTGADAYLPKPFDLETLKQVVMNQLQSRQRIQDKYASQGAVPLPEEVTISYADESFLTKLNRLIEQHISNTALDISLLEGEMGMSRASLFNKMKAITGMGCNEYITKIRMEKAIQYIKESNLTFTEISEKVGYNTASYFSSAFKQYTGMTPTQYRKSQKNG